MQRNMLYICLKLKQRYKLGDKTNTAMRSCIVLKALSDHAFYSKVNKRFPGEHTSIFLDFSGAEQSKYQTSVVEDAISIDKDGLARFR